METLVCFQPQIILLKIMTVLLLPATWATLQHSVTTSRFLLNNSSSVTNEDMVHPLNLPDLLLCFSRCGLIKSSPISVQRSLKHQRDDNKHLLLNWDEVQANKKQQPQMLCSGSCLARGLLDERL